MCLLTTEECPKLGVKHGKGRHMCCLKTNLSFLYKIIFNNFRVSPYPQVMIWSRRLGGFAGVVSQINPQKPGVQNPIHTHPNQQLRVTREVGQSSLERRLARELGTSRYIESFQEVQHLVTPDIRGRSFVWVKFSRKYLVETHIWWFKSDIWNSPKGLRLLRVSFSFESFFYFSPPSPV